MTDLDQLPPERDLPADRQARMRHRLLTAHSRDTAYGPGALPGLGTAPGPARPAARRRSRLVRVLGAGLATAACAAVAVAWSSGLLGGAELPKPEVIALGDGALSPMVRVTGNLCLTHAKDYATRDDGYTPGFTWPANARPTLVNYAQRDDRAIVVYRLGQTAIMCTMEPTFPPSDEWSSSMGFAALPQWLPGPVSGESGSSSDPWGGESAISGFVSRRVARVVLDDGEGHRSTARLADGTFAVLSDGDLAANGGELISYDAQGREIDRRPAFDQGPVGTTCWLDDAGKVVLFGMDRKDMPTPSPAGCGRAEPWAPPKGWTPA